MLSDHYPLDVGEAACDVHALLSAVGGAVDVLLRYADPEHWLPVLWGSGADALTWLEQAREELARLDALSLELERALVDFGGLWREAARALRLDV